MGWSSTLFPKIKVVKGDYNKWIIMNFTKDSKTDGECFEEIHKILSLGKVTRCTGIWDPWASSHHEEHGKKGIFNP
eukprot:6926356-Ditylum_brightwellii.AAC.1